MCLERRRLCRPTTRRWPSAGACMTWVTMTARRCRLKGQERRRARLQKCGAPDNLVGFVLGSAVALLIGAPDRVAALQERSPLAEGLTIVTALAEARGDPARAAQGSAGRA